MFAFTRAGDEAHAGVRARARAPPGQAARRGAARAARRRDHLRPGRRAGPAGAGAVAPGGTVVCAGIHMSDIPSFPYEDLWHERTIRSVANLTREDGRRSSTSRPGSRSARRPRRYPLEQAEQALADLRAGRVTARRSRRTVGFTPCPCSHGHRAHRPRRARVRHLLPAAQRADHLPRHADRRHGRQPDRRPAAAPGVRRTPTRTSRSTSTRRAARSTRGWRSTTRCSSSSPTSRRSASASRCRWARCC